MKISVKFTLLLLTASVVSACNLGGDTNTVDLFNGTEIALRTGERAAPAQTADTEDFFELIGSRPYQTPLFRVIDAGEARIYIALPVGDERQLWEHPVKEGLSEISEAQPRRFRASQYNVSEFQISEYLAHIQGNYILLLAASRNADLVNSRFAPDSLRHRILIHD